MRVRCYFSLLTLACLVTSCALEHAVPPPTAGPLDSTLRAAGLTTGRIKFNGPVTLQLGGSGNVATTLAKAKGPVASAPHATATATKASPVWWVYGLVAALSFAGGFLVRGKLKIPLPF